MNVDIEASKALEDLTQSHIDTQAIPKITLNLLAYVYHYLTNAINIGIRYTFLNGSFNSRTAIINKSDIDLLVVFDPGHKVKDPFDIFKKMVLALDGALLEICKHDIDGGLDFPAFCIRHLSFPNFPIEITPSITTNTAGIYLGTQTEPDFLILGGSGNELIATNPKSHYVVTQYLNKITNMRYSQIVILLKLLKIRNELPIISIGIEILVYHWIRGSLQDPKCMLLESLNGEINTNFTSKVELNSIFNAFVNILTNIEEILTKNSTVDKIVRLPNPFVRFKIPNQLFQLFTTIEDQQFTLKTIKSVVNNLGGIQYKSSNRELIKLLNNIFVGEQ